VIVATAILTLRLLFEEEIRMLRMDMEVMVEKIRMLVEEIRMPVAAAVTHTVAGVTAAVRLTAALLSMHKEVETDMHSLSSSLTVTKKRVLVG
jgi:hypothetical protein